MELLSKVTDSGTDPSGREVFEILAHEHADMLVAYLRSLVRRQDQVDDIFQETMLTAWRRLADYDRERPFAPWLRGIATRLVLQQRDRSARDLLICDTGVLEALEERHRQQAARHDSFRKTADRLLDCLRRLPTKLRAVIDLVYEQGLRLKQVGRELDSSEEAVKKRLQRGRRLLADCLLELEASHE